MVELILGLSKGVGFIRFDQRIEAERAIKELNGTIPKGYAEPITVKFANNPSSSKAFPPLTAYLTPQTAAARRFAGPIHHPTGRFRLVSYTSALCCDMACKVPCKDPRFVWLSSTRFGFFSSIFQMVFSIIS